MASGEDVMDGCGVGWMEQLIGGLAVLTALQRERVAERDSANVCVSRTTRYERGDRVKK
jgi:hypothetical protein